MQYDYDELPTRGKILSTGEKLRECNSCGGRTYMFYDENRNYHIECEDCDETHKLIAKSLDEAMTQWNELIITCDNCEYCPLGWENTTYEGECIDCGCYVNEDLYWCKKSYAERLKKAKEFEHS
jgi:hypothetical protein